MARWQDQDCILYRGTPTGAGPDSPSAKDILLPISGATPSDPIYGGPIQTAGKRLENVIDGRRSILITHPPYSVEADKYPEFAGYGRWGYFESVISKMGDLYIVALYLVGSDPDAGPPPRSWYDPVTDTESDEYWVSGNAFTFPLLVTASGPFNVQPTHDIAMTTAQPYTLLVAEG